MIESTIEFDILCIGFDLTLMGQVASQFGTLRFKYLKTAAEFESFLDRYQIPEGSHVFLSTSTEGISTLEVAQAVRSYYSGVFITYLTMDQSQFNITELKKNGVNDCLLWPQDAKVFGTTLAAIKDAAGKRDQRRLKAVKLVDIEPGIELPFEIRAYMPLNNRYVPITGSGLLSQRKYDILKKQQRSSVFVDETEVEKFYEFSAQRLVALGVPNTDATTETARIDRLQTSVRELFQNVLNSSQAETTFDSGRDLLDQSKRLVENYVKLKSGVDLRHQLVNVVGEGSDSYSHAQIVSTVACLLSLASGIGTPEDLAIAGLFHDIGMQGKHDILSPLEPFDLPEVERESYLKHPKRSLLLLREKKVTVTPEIAEVIENHHERIDGKGFPSQLPAHKISLSAQLLAYADAVEFLSRPQAGKKSLGLVEVHAEISAKMGLSQQVLLAVSRAIGAQ